VRHGGIVKGQRKIIIVPERLRLERGAYAPSDASGGGAPRALSEDGGEPREYSLPRGVHVSACGPADPEMEENERVIAAGGRPATGRPLLPGITKASLSTDSFISACAP
jgi:hypothetical protein